MRKPEFNPRTVHVQMWWILWNWKGFSLNSCVCQCQCHSGVCQCQCHSTCAPYSSCASAIVNQPVLHTHPPTPTLTIQLHSTMYDCCILTSCQHSYQDGYGQHDKSTAPTDAASPWLWLPLVLGDVELLTPGDTTAAVNIQFTVR